MSQRLSREQMLDLVDRIRRSEGTEEEADADIELFIANCAHPSGSDLIFWPDLVPEFPPGYEPKVAEIIDLAMSGSAAE